MSSFCIKVIHEYVLSEIYKLLYFACSSIFIKCTCKYFCLPSIPHSILCVWLNGDVIGSLWLSILSNNTTQLQANEYQITTHSEEHY
jgi:hypothetical protein